MTYVSMPINTESVELADALNDLIEALVENIHDQWALGRINEGWQYGPERNDEENCTHAWSLATICRIRKRI